VDAALFAFRNPFSRGAILADEVGLGKTIEAGLLLSQHWAERKRKLIIILPANLRKQWSQELADKVHLPSAILESRTFNEAIRAGNLNPFVQPGIVLCSFQFARSKEPYIRQVAWDLVVIDEAHRLRNVYKTSSRIALAIKNAVAPFPKILLTATPLQNSLLELYGLVSIIDDYAFGDLNSFRARFSRLSSDADFSELKERLKPICKGQRDAREKLLDNFDQEVVEKVRVQSSDVLDRFNRRLWLMTRHVLADYADFVDATYSFQLRDNPFPGETIHPGPYRLGKPFAVIVTADEV
jgi:SNF2 family DNA or RNA helicase